MKFCLEMKIAPHGSFWLAGDDAFVDGCNLLRLRRDFDRSRSAADLGLWLQAAKSRDL